MGPDAIAIRSKFKAAHLDQLRYGVEQARENGYCPYNALPMLGHSVSGLAGQPSVAMAAAVKPAVSTKRNAQPDSFSRASSLATSIRF